MTSASGQDVALQVYTTDSGIWRIDKEIGKHLVILRLTHRETGESLTYCPRWDDLHNIIRQMLDAEKKNDDFRFSNPKIRHRRPQEFEVKLNALIKLLDELAPFSLEGMW